MPSITGPSRDLKADLTLAYALFRLTVGVNLLMHGLTRLFGDYRGFVAGMVGDFSETILPSWSVQAFALAVPPVETAIGLLLIIGLWTRGTLVAGNLLITLLTFGTTLKQNWGTAGSQLVYALALALLLALHSYNGWSLDGRRVRTPDQAG